MSDQEAAGASSQEVALPIASPPFSAGEAQLQEKKEKPAKKRFSRRYILVLALVLALAGVGFGAYWVLIKPGRVSPSYPLPESPAESTPSAQPSLVPAQPAEAQNVAEAHNIFGFNLLKVLSARKAENVIISPLSISMAYSMVYNGAGGETKNQLAATLQVSQYTVDEVNRENAVLMQNLQARDPKVELVMANSIWAREGVNFNQSFLDRNQQYYQAKVGVLDFSQPEAADIINAWVNQNTRGKIPSIVNRPLNPLSVMWLINAVYFKGAWEEEFDKDFTTEREFVISADQKVQAKFMYQYRDDFQYFENDDFQAVSLPYGEGKKISMMVFLPKGELTAFINSLDAAHWGAWHSSFQEREGTLELPKFTLEYSTSLVEPLMSLGLHDAFSGAADFSGIYGGLFISESHHKTFIEVNEEGTEAAAATSIGMSLALPLEDKETFYMMVNKPFFFAITDSQSSEILFSGLVYNPLGS